MRGTDSGPSIRVSKSVCSPPLSSRVACNELTKISVRFQYVNPALQRKISFPHASSASLHVAELAQDVRCLLARNSQSSLIVRRVGMHFWLRFRMIAEILLHGFISQLKFEAAVRIHVRGLLHIQRVERQHVLHGALT